MSTKYLSCAETAKLLRLALKESFPGVKFSVTSKTYSGGASITVGYEDGPTVAMVKGVSDQFEGSYFDGMIDYKGSRYFKLDGEKVDLAADFVFVERRLSKARAESIVARFSEEFGRSDWVKVEGCDYFGYRAAIQSQAPYISREVQEYDAATCGVEIKESATLKRLTLTGDDGYGAGTIGRDGSGQDTGQGYPRYSAA